MATLYDLAMQYLNQSLPKTFKYDRTPPIGINPPTQPGGPAEPIAKILPVPGGNEEGFSVYNPDPNRTRNESNYNPRTYNKVMRDTDKFGETVMPNPDLYYTKELEGIPGMVQGYMKNSIPGRLIGKAVSGLESLLPVNQRAILENELLGQGFQLNDIGQFVSDGGDINKADGSNIMAGYNANKVTAETFQKRRDMINAKMKDPEQKAAKLKALDEAEAKILGTAKTRADMIFEDKMITKDPSLKGPGYLENAFDFTTEEDDSEDDMLDYTNPNIYNTDSIYTQTAPTYTTDPYVSGQDDKDIDTTPKVTDDGTPDYYGGVGDSVIDAGGTAPGGGYTSDYYGGVGDSVIDAGGTAPGGGYTSDYYGGGNDNTGSSYNAGSGYNTTGKGGPAGQGSPKYGTGSGNLGDYQIQPTDSGNDSSNDSKSKIVCTMMNESYGFGSFRNKIWLKHSKGLAPEYQKGYHKLFLPLVKIAKTNKVVRKILEHIAVHRTIDIRQESRGKVHLLGRVYRKILEPICYFVGKHG